MIELRTSIQATVEIPWGMNLSIRVWWKNLGVPVNTDITALFGSLTGNPSNPISIAFSESETPPYGFGTTDGGYLTINKRFDEANGVDPSVAVVTHDIAVVIGDYVAGQGTWAGTFPNGVYAYVFADEAYNVLLPAAEVNVTGVSFIVS